MSHGCRFIGSYVSSVIQNGVYGKGEHSALGFGIVLSVEEVDLAPVLAGMQKLVRQGGAHLPVTQVVGAHLHRAVEHEVALLRHALEPALEQSTFDAVHRSTDVEKMTEDGLEHSGIRHAQLVVDVGLEAALNGLQKLHCHVQGPIRNTHREALKIFRIVSEVAGHKLHAALLQSNTEFRYVKGHYSRV